LKGEQFVQEYFFAYQLNEREFDEFLSAGWRRFGLFFFRPTCPGCRRCIPIRVLSSQFKPTKSQRRVLRKNRETEVRLSPPQFRKEIFEIYKKHSKEKFDQEIYRDDS
jgi:arginine-tRNA-protein transferase